MAELGETDDLKQLVPGNTAQIAATAQALRTRAGELEQAGAGLSRIDTADGWRGPAGDAFRAKFHGQPSSWLTAGDSFQDAAAALDTYSSTLAWAQEQAQQAINEWTAAQAATRQAQTDYQTYQQQGGTKPFQDPGENGRAAAKKTLDNARISLENAGNTAAATVGPARDRAPEKPGFWSKVGHVADEIGAGAENAGGEVVNAFASVGNAMLHHPGDVAEMVGGAFITAASAAGVGASGLLDATVVLSPAGIALGGVSVLGVGAGATMAMAGASDISMHAEGDDQVSPASTDHTAGDDPTATDLGPDLTDDVSRNIARHANEEAIRPDGDGTHYVRGVSQDAMGEYVDGVRDGVVPNVEERYLKNGRVGYWDPDKEAVVIEDGEEGTVFTPKEGKAYFDRLK
jgi:type VII secretion system ESX-1 substrate